MIAYARNDPTPSPDGWTEIPNWEMCEISALKLDNFPCPLELALLDELTVTIGDFSETVAPEEVQATVKRLIAKHQGREGC